jgi:hypothetical protein
MSVEGVKKSDEAIARTIASNAKDSRDQVHNYEGDYSLTSNTIKLIGRATSGEVACVVDGRSVRVLGRESLSLGGEEAHLWGESVTVGSEDSVIRLEPKKFSVRVCSPLSFWEEEDKRRRLLDAKWDTGEASMDPEEFEQLAGTKNVADIEIAEAQINIGIRQPSKLDDASYLSNLTVKGDCVRLAAGKSKITLTPDGIKLEGSKIELSSKLLLALKSMILEEESTQRKNRTNLDWNG